MKANNYDVVEAGETITFRGLVQRSTSQAFFLVFCTALGMASLALVLQIQFQNLGTCVDVVVVVVDDEGVTSFKSYLMLPVFFLVQYHTVTVTLITLL